MRLGTRYQSYENQFGQDEQAGQETGIDREIAVLLAVDQDLAQELRMPFEERNPQAFIARNLRISVAPTRINVA